MLAATVAKLYFGRVRRMAHDRLQARRRANRHNTERVATYYVAAKATYIRLLHGKIGFLFFFGPSSVKRGRTHIVLG